VKKHFQNKHDQEEYYERQGIFHAVNTTYTADSHPNSTRNNKKTT